MIHTEKNNSTKEITRINYLDGIRGWASLAVLLSHILMCFLVLSTPFLQYNEARIAKDISTYNYIDIIIGVILRFITDGHLAVLIFFVLSGYALSAGNLNLHRRNLALAATARYFRLMIPILFTSLIAYLLCKFNLMFNAEVATTPERSSNWLGTFYKFEPNIKDAIKFSLFDVFFRYDSSKTYNSSLWTIPIEILGSFMIYSYLGIFRSTEKIHIKLAAMIAIALFAINPLLFCFFAGYLISELNNNKSYGEFIWRPIQRWGNLISLAMFLACAFLSTFFRDNDFRTSIFASGIVLSISLSPTLKTFFQNKYSIFLGKISFPLYLIQIPIICSWSSYLYLKLPALGFSITTSNLINFISTIILAMVSAFILLPIEKISVRHSKKIGNFFLGAVSNPKCNTAQNG